MGAAPFGGQACTHRRVGACLSPVMGGADPGIGACTDSQITRLTLSYDGGAFAGWARQPGLRTVQEVLEGAIERILRVPLSLSVAGRTDRGVHACSASRSRNQGTHSARPSSKGERTGPASTR